MYTLYIQKKQQQQQQQIAKRENDRDTNLPDILFRIGRLVLILCKEDPPD
jgi:hypothetical protein